MGTLINNIANLGRKINKFDPLDRAVQNFVLGKPKPGTSYYGEASPTPGSAPTSDTAANLSNQQAQLRNLQRGVLSNIYAGGNAPAPSVGTRTLLGG